MEVHEEKILSKILNGSELEKIPNDIAKKLESYFVVKFEEYLTSKALCEAKKSDIERLREGLEKKITELASQNEDYIAKLLQSKQSAHELRTELDTSRKEAKSLHEAVNKYENETSEYRKERNEAVDERDSLLKMIERRNIEVERLQSDILTLESQLNAAINTKCEALAKVDEIQSKEVSLEYKEKRMDQEKTLLNNTIKTLNDDLNRNMAELTSIRREHTLRVISLETKLNEKTEELKITNSINAQLIETNNSLTIKSEDLNTKLFKHSEEVTKMMDNYKKELIAKTKLAELYKESSDDCKNQINELSAAIGELKKLLNEATDEYGVLETKFKQSESNHAEELEEKEKKIEELRDELRHANELLKASREENIEHAIENIAPTAAASSRLIKSGMSLTEIYSVYVKTSEELQLKKKENARLIIQINSILQEVAENAPKFQKQAIEHQNLVESNTEMKQQIDNMISERVDAREELNDAIAKVNYFERENKKLKTELADVARQVCFLLKEVEQIRGGYVSETAQSVTSDMSAEEVITKQLVTFSNIEELQQRNQNLLNIVRDLSGKLEEMDQGHVNLQNENFASKIETYTKRIKELQDAQEAQTQMFSTCMQQKERYKKLYYDSIKNFSNKTGQFDGASLNGGDDIQMEEDIPLASSSSISSSHDQGRDKQKILELEGKLKDLTTQLKTIKEEYDNYRKEKLTNEKMVNEQFDSMRNEMRELTSTNCRLSSQSEFSTEQLKIIQKNVAAYKKQISALEERNKNYESSIIKHEQTIMHIKDEALSAQSKASRYEVTIDHLKQECQILRDNESRLQLEREVLNRERQNQNLLLNNLEMIKVSFERSETEGRMRMESRLDELTRECSALRRRLQEEQDRFRELSVHLERQTETAKQKMEDEIVQATKLRKELEHIRHENLEKSQQIEDLSKKLQESLTPSLHDNPIAQANKRAREMEMKYEQMKSDLAMLEKELENSKEHVKQYSVLANSSEKELKELHDKYSLEKGQLEHELARLKKLELENKARIEELETEISLQITGAQLNSGDTTSQLHKAQLELQEALQKLNENNRELRELRSENHNLSSSIQVAEQKYANEMIQHSTDIQAMTKLKEELNRVMEQVNGIKLERDKAVETLNMTSKGWDEKDRLITCEREQLEQRIDDLNSQNTALHDQIQVLSTKLSVTAAVTISSTSTNETPDNGSGDVEMSDSFMNKTLNEEEIKSSEQLLQIVKYLRKEKDIAVAKVDILRSETSRLQSEQSVLQTKLDQAVNSLEQERTKTDVGVVTASKHSELLRKIETLNAITDSNRILREERDTLSKKVQELTDRVTKVEDELFPLQEKNRDLSARSDAAAAENASLRIEATRWRQRANLLVERSNKSSPEDFKRLQTERENLAKMLTAEKDILKRTNDELTTIKTEKLRLDTELQNLTKQLSASQDDCKKFQDDVITLKQTNVRMTHEIIELKNNVLLKEEEIKKISDELNNKEAILADAKNKEIQIRKIAKRYKDSYFELKNKDLTKDGDKTDETSNPGGEASTSAAKSESDKLIQEKINEMNAQILSAQEENENLRKENEMLKAGVEKEEKNKNLLKEAKTRILSLTETKNAISRELTATKLQLQNIEQNREDNDLLVNGLKTQFETRISRIEIQHSEQDKEKQEAIGRLTRENENLLLIINQLNRQLQGLKPSTSSNPIEKASTDSPRTANVKPMAGPSGQQSATVTPWRGEPPLASIRPIQNSRTAAVLPTSQTSNIASVQGSSSSGSVTALVPPQQQVHTTGNNNSGEALSSSPTSSHTDYMPATSSAAVVVAAVPPMGSGAANAESSQEAESLPTLNNDSPSNQIIITGGQQQQAVALVSPRVEGAQQNVVPPQSTAPISNQEVNQAPSTSGTSSTTPAAISSHHQASSSNTVTTTQAAHKRPRDIEGDSSTGNNDESEKQTQVKRPRAQGSEAFQGVSESGIEVEYQVPTSSQRDQEDDIIVVDSEDDDDGMADEGNAEADDGPFEDEADNGDAYEMEESYEQEQEMANYDEGEGPDIDEDNVQSDNNEVEVDDSSEVPNQSGSSTHVAPDGGSASVVTNQIGSSDVPVASTQNSSEIQQIQTISSGSDAPGSSTARQNSPHSRQAQASHLVLLQQGYEESGDDSIVPSTPTLYTPRRGDGFSEAVSSPHSQVPHTVRFTFSEPRAIPGPSSLVPNDGMDDTRVDLSELDEINSRSISNTPQKVESGSSENTSGLSNGAQQQDVVAGSSRSDAASVPEIMITGASGEDDMDDDATTSDAPDEDRDTDKNESGDIDEGEGADGVSSEGEKAPGAEGIIVEEGREAEATQSPSSNTRSRSTRGPGSGQRRGGRYNNRANRAPIIWGDSQRGGASGRNLQINVRNIDSGSPSRQIFQGQRPQRARRMKHRPFGNNNMRY